MTDSDELMDAFPGFSTKCHKKGIILSKKKKKARRNVFGDYLKASFVTILKMDASTCITTLILAWEDVVNLPDVRRFFVTCLMLPKGKASTAFTSNTPETVVMSKSKIKC